MKFPVISTIFLISCKLHYVKAALCNNTQLWCQKSGYGLTSFSPEYSSLLNQTEYKTCLHYCHGNITCKAFEYKKNQGTCRFSSTLSQNVKQINSTEDDVFGRKLQAFHVRRKSYTVRTSVKIIFTPT